MYNCSVYVGRDDVRSGLRLVITCSSATRGIINITRSVNNQYMLTSALVKTLNGLKEMICEDIRTRPISLKNCAVVNDVVVCDCVDDDIIKELNNLVKEYG